MFKAFSSRATAFLTGVTLLGMTGHALGSNQDDPAAQPAHRRSSESASVPRAPRRAEPVLQEVIVTAQKRRQRAFDVPISLIVIGGPQLQREHITDLTDLQFAVPGLTVESGGAQQRLDMRGISNAAGNGALVGEYLDEADVTPAGFAGAFGYGTFDIPTYDLQRVEVLRGPQGTLYGEGSMGGTIRFISNQPVLDRFQISADTTALFTQGGAPGQRIDAMINTPVVQNILGLRFAAEFDHEGGWIDQPAAGAENINGENLVDVRVEGLWEPLSNFKVGATQIIHRNAYGPNMGANDSENYTQTFNLTTVPEAQDDFEVSNVTLTYDFDHTQLLNSSTWFNHVQGARNDGYIIPLGAVVYSVYIPNLRDTSGNVSEELRWARTGDGAWQWTVGGFLKHFHDDFSDSYYLGIAGPPGTPLPPIIPSAQSDTSIAWSGFADTSYRILNRLTAGAGVRYFKDRETLSSVGLQSGTFHSVDPRFYLRYQLTADVNTYASAAKGFRSGGFNSSGQPPYDPESVWTYELGTKMRFHGGRLRADADVFYSNYSNFVIIGFTTENPVNIYRNAGTVRIKGVEGDLAWVPAERWTLSVTGDYMNARFVELTELGTGYAIGDVEDLVPRYAITAAAQRDFDWQGRPVFARIDYSQRVPESPYYEPEYHTGSDYLYLLDFSAGVRLSNSVRLGFFAKNLLDVRGFMDDTFASEHVAARQQPRTFGIDFGVSLD